MKKIISLSLLMVLFGCGTAVHHKPDPEIVRKHNERKDFNTDLITKSFMEDVWSVPIKQLMKNATKTTKGNLVAILPLKLKAKSYGSMNTINEYKNHLECNKNNRSNLAWVVSKYKNKDYPKLELYKVMLALNLKRKFPGSNECHYGRYVKDDGNFLLLHGRGFKVAVHQRGKFLEKLHYYGFPTQVKMPELCVPDNGPPGSKSQVYFCQIDGNYEDAFFRPNVFIQKRIANDNFDTFLLQNLSIPKDLNQFSFNDIYTSRLEDKTYYGFMRKLQADLKVELKNERNSQHAAANRKAREERRKEREAQAWHDYQQNWHKREGYGDNGNSLYESMQKEQAFWNNIQNIQDKTMNAINQNRKNYLQTKKAQQKRPQPRTYTPPKKWKTSTAGKPKARSFSKYELF